MSFFCLLNGEYYLLWGFENGLLTRFSIHYLKKPELSVNSRPSFKMARGNITQEDPLLISSSYS